MARCMVDAESHCKLYPRCYGCNAFRNPTNADRIRSMSDEELACKAKERGKVSRRGKPSIEWYKGGKPQRYCYGYIDKMTDELLVECKECRSHVYKAQGELDKYNCRKE